MTGDMRGFYGLGGNFIPLEPEQRREITRERKRVDKDEKKHRDAHAEELAKSGLRLFLIHSSTPRLRGLAGCLPRDRSSYRGSASSSRTTEVFCTSQKSVNARLLALPMRRASLPRSARRWSAFSPPMMRKRICGMTSRATND
jgi:hypothetical protein